MCHPHKISFEHETLNICQIVFSIISGIMRHCYDQERQHLTQSFPFRKTHTDCSTTLTTNTEMPANCFSYPYIETPDSLCFDTPASSHGKPEGGVHT